MTSTAREERQGRLHRSEETQPKIKYIHRFLSVAGSCPGHTLSVLGSRAIGIPRDKETLMGSASSLPGPGNTDVNKTHTTIPALMKLTPCTGRPSINKLVLSSTEIRTISGDGKKTVRGGRGVGIYGFEWVGEAYPRKRE